jgi:lysozyme family protein
MRYGVKWPVYAKQWDAMTINPGRLDEFTKEAQFAVDNKVFYRAVEDATGVLWPHVAVIHRRESDGDFHTYLGNGDPLDKPTRHVPRGRGPFKSFLEGAIDALNLDGLMDVTDWRLEKVLYYCEIFNGTGYNNHGVSSPYVWGGTNQQDRGKYVSDGEFDPDVMDSQPGCAPLLYMIAKLDPSVQFVRES